MFINNVFYVQGPQNFYEKTQLSVDKYFKKSQDIVCRLIFVDKTILWRNNDYIFFEGFGNREKRGLF